MIDRRTQLKLWLLALDRFELRLRGAIALQRAKYIRAAASVYESHAFIPAWLNNDHIQGINSILSAHYQSVIPYFGRMVVKQVKSRKISQKAVDNLFTHFMQEWVSTEALRKARMIWNTDYGDVQNAISNGLAAGDGVSAIASRITDVSGLTPFRAATVARTETHNAATFGSIETARDLGREFGVQMLKAWLPTIDDRTRPEHRAMENKDPIPLDERFDVGGESMDRPGDPSAQPDNVINCRCAIAYEEKQ